MQLVREASVIATFHRFPYPRISVHLPLSHIIYSKTPLQKPQDLIYSIIKANEILKALLGSEIIHKLCQQKTNTFSYNANHWSQS